MNYLKLPLVVLLSICVSGLLAIVPAGAQGQTTASSAVIAQVIQTVTRRASRMFPTEPRGIIRTKRIIKRADRSYNDVWGPIEDYRDGYQQGFEAGYTAGFERQQFNSTLPTGLASTRRPTAAPTVDDNVSTPAPIAPTFRLTPIRTVTPSGSLSIPRNTILALELLTPLSTDASQRGDRLQATRYRTGGIRWLYR